MNDGSIEDFLIGNIGRQVEISYAYHNEGVHRWTKGLLDKVTSNVIRIRNKYKPSRWKHAKDSVFVLNRHACVLHSMVVLDWDAKRNE